MKKKSFYAKFWPIFDTLCVFVLVVLLLGISGGCATQQATNQLIAEANQNRFEAFSKGLVGCGDNAACQGMLGMAFAAGLGQQQFFKEDSGVDYLKAGFPYADVSARIFTSWWGGRSNGDSAGIVVNGHNNQFHGVANKLTADNQSTLTGTFDTESKIEHLVYTQDSTQSSANGTSAVSNVENQQDTNYKPTE